MPTAADSDSASHRVVLRNLIAQYRGEKDARQFERFHPSDLPLIGNLGKELLDHTPIFHGACAAVSAAWVALLRDRHDIPAVAVAGDLVIEGVPVFICERNVPESTESADMTPWDGHCWIEVDGYVGDASIFRTARTIDRPSRLKSFIEREFGLERGLMVTSRQSLGAIDMIYSAKYVLSETQINGLLAGLRSQIEGAVSKR